MTKEDAYCELSFSPNVSLIATVRRFVGEFYERVLGDEEVASRLVVATHELLENTVRYSCDGRSTIRIGVGRNGDVLDVAIDTKNRTTSEHRDSLSVLLAEMHASNDRGGFYQMLLRRTAKRDIGSGLGLGRIYAESEMDLSYRFEADEVRLRAKGSFPALKAGR